MAGVCGGRFVLEWNDGRSMEVGTVEVDTGKLGAECRVRMRMFSLGWEFIRIGIRIWKRGFKNE